MRYASWKKHLYALAFSVFRLQIVLLECFPSAANLRKHLRKFSENVQYQHHIRVKSLVFLIKHALAKSESAFDSPTCDIDIILGIQ